MGEGASHTLLRGVRCTSGRVAVETTYRPRPEYGLVVPAFSEMEAGFVATGGSGRLTLTTPVPATASNGEVRARFTLEAGESRFFALQRTGLGEPLPGALSQDRIGAALDATVAAGGTGRRSTGATTVRGASSSATRGGCCTR